MALKKYCVIALLAIVAIVLSVCSPIALADYSPESSPELHTGWMMETYDGYNGTWSCNRTYLYYIPSGYTSSTAVPLLFSFHGIGSSGEEQETLTSFAELAEQEGFIAVFPDATTLEEDDNPCAENLIGKYNPVLAGLDLTQWNLGLNWSLQYCAGVDDVGFVSDMIDWFETNYNIDTSRIYATGMSLGAFFSYYVALMLPDTFAGIAPVCAPMLTNMFDFEGVPPLTVITMMSPTDPINPYNGDDTGTIRSMDDTIAFWLGVNNITSEPVTTVWSDDAIDPTTVTRYAYSGGTNGTEVIFFKVEGSKGGYNVGHTWPGGPQYSYSFVIGSVSNQIDGSALIWKHLPPVQNYLRIRSTDGGSVTTPGERTFFYDPDPNPIQFNLVAVPDSNCRFVNWTWNLNEGSIENATATSTNITITPDEDYEILANFIAQYDLTIDSTDGGNVTAPGEGLFPDNDAGTVVNLVATPNAGYRFVNWTGTGSGNIANRYTAETTITMRGNSHITANFVEESEEPGGGGCFIATAAYGTSTAEQLNVLREFRDDVLLESTVGSQLVDLYYRTSPPIADFISEHSVMRTLVRELLIDPIVWVVEATGDIWRN